MSLISLSLTNTTITPPTREYTNSVYELSINNKTIYCDLSSANINDDDFNLILTLNNYENDVQKFHVLFVNNANNPVVSTLTINNKNIQIFLNNRDDIATSKINYQEFMITCKSSTYTAISTLRKYN